MAEEVEEVCGPRGRHDPDQVAYRHGSDDGEVTPSAWSSLPMTASDRPHSLAMTRQDGGYDDDYNEPAASRRASPERAKSRRSRQKLSYSLSYWLRPDRGLQRQAGERTGPDRETVGGT